MNLAAAPRSAPAWDPLFAPRIIAARRTAFCRRGGALAAHSETSLAAEVLDALLREVRDLGVTQDVDEVILGNVLGPGGNVARVASLQAGLGQSTAGVTVDRQCGSGQEAIHQAAALVGSGMASVVLAGGTQQVSQLPSPPPRAAFAPAPDDPDMGPAAQDLADRHRIDRAAQDAFALTSHQRAAATRDAGGFAAELVAVQGMTRDDRPRDRLTASLLARMPGAFCPGGSVSVANSCADADGAAVVALVPEWLRAGLGCPALGITAFTAVGCPPPLPGLGAGLAIARLAELVPGPWDVMEITEAFAAQVLASCEVAGLDPHRVNLQGGAIALGHPWAASGAALVVRLFAQLVRVPVGATGVAACAIGGGQGVALAVERVG